MSAPKKKNSSVVTIRARKTIALPAGTLGFSSLIEPDTYDPEKPTFKLNHHLSPQALHQFPDLIREKVYTEASLEELRKEAEENGIKKIGAFKDAEAWLEAKLKDPRESDVVQHPFIVLSNRATYWKNGEQVPRQVKAWSANNTLLDLKKLRLGRGSLIEPIVFPNIFFSKINGDIQPSLKLIGVRVLQLKSFGRGAAPQEAEKDEEAIKEVLGENFAFDDLAAYAAGADEDEDDHADTPPTDEADRLFGNND